MELETTRAATGSVPCARPPRAQRASRLLHPHRGPLYLADRGAGRILGAHGTARIWGQWLPRPFPHHGQDEAPRRCGRVLVDIRSHRRFNHSVPARDRPDAWRDAGRAPSTARESEPSASRECVLRGLASPSSTAATPRGPLYLLRCLGLVALLRRRDERREPPFRGGRSGHSGPIEVTAMLPGWPAAPRSV